MDFTNHDHLGKLITYAANSDAKNIIWIVGNYREEHKQAIDWLNENIGEDINLFLVKVELFQIDNSLPAPNFDVISSPNDWARRAKRISDYGRFTDTKMKQLEFWNKFREYNEKTKSKLRLRKTYPQHWYDLSYGNSNARVNISSIQHGGCKIYYLINS